MSLKIKKGSFKVKKDGVFEPIDVLMGSGSGGGMTEAEADQKYAPKVHNHAELENEVSNINAGLSYLQNKDKSTQTGKVWGTTSDGAGWIDAPQGGNGGGSGATAEQIAQIQKNAENIESLSEILEVGTEIGEELPTVTSVSQMVDTSKKYVMDGYVYRYRQTGTQEGEKVPNFTNLLDGMTLSDVGMGLNLSTGAVEVQSNGRGCVTDFIPVTKGDIIYMNNCMNGGSGGNVNNDNERIGLYKADGSAKRMRICGQRVVNVEGLTASGSSVYGDFYAEKYNGQYQYVKIDLQGIETDVTQMRLGIVPPSRTGVVSFNDGGQIITKNQPITYTTQTVPVYEWVKGEEYEGGSSVDTNAIIKLKRRITALENGSNSHVDGYRYRQNLPSCYVTPPENPTSYHDDAYIDAYIDDIPNGKHFVFFTDTHWERNFKHATDCIQYIRSVTGIKDVLWGGDFLDIQTTKYKAKQILNDFSRRCISAWGNHFIPIYGNHDTNVANTYNDVTTPDRYLPPSVFESCIMQSQDRCEYFDFSDKINALPNATQEQKNELASMLRMCYAINDDEQKIRYIIMATGAPSYGHIYDLFGINIWTILQYDAVYEFLMNTPNGYDVCLMGHAFGMLHENPPAMQYQMRRMIQMLMGLKSKTQKYTYITATKNDNLTSWLPMNAYTYDFTNAPTVGKVFVVAGDTHRDAVMICRQSASDQASVEYEFYDSYNTSPIIDQTVVTANNGIAIPMIWTNCDADRHCTIEEPDSTHFLVEEGSTDMQCFDTMTIKDDAIVATRFGWYEPGKARTRTININA